MKNIKERFGSKLKKRNGFTLIEMLIVVAIIAILVMVSIPLVTTSIEDAKVATDAANLRSAKAAAVIEALGNHMEFSSSSSYYYDIKSGEITTTKPEGYNQSSLSGVLTSAVEKETQVIQVVVTGTDGQTIECKWVAE